MNTTGDPSRPTELLQIACDYFWCLRLDEVVMGMVVDQVRDQVDHAINVEGDREAAKVANLVHKELSDEVRGHLAVHHVGLLLYRLVYHLVQNHPKHHLTLSRCHKYSQAIWRSSVGLLWSPVVFISQKSVFSETPCIIVSKFQKI